MSQFEEQETNAADAEQAPDGSAPEMGDESDMGFVAERPKGNRNGVMLLVGLLLLGGATIYFMRLKGGPQTAQASPESATAKATITEFLSDGGRNITQMRDTLKNTEVIVQQFATQSNEHQVPVENLKTNPFQMLETKPPKDPNEEKRIQDAIDAAQAAAARAKLMGEIKQGASALRVESIMLGKTPICMINNTAFTAGQEINGFKIDSIEKGFIIVSKSGFRLKLAMQSK
jgi:hypothetical protein